MDRSVKERLVGASILVLLIVLIVPELLSGPAPAPVDLKAPASAPEPVRNVTVDLATNQPPVQEPVPDAAASSVPPVDTAARMGAAVPSGAAPPAGTAVDTSPAVTTPAAAPRPPLSVVPLESAAPAPTTARRAWAVQLGSFASRANADKLVRQLKAEGFAVYELPGGSGASLRYRVRVGPMADRGAASQAAGKLKSLGHAASLVPPAP